MKAVTFQGIKNVKVKEVKDPKIQKADDIIVKLTSTAICGSDLHLIHDMVPNLPQDYIIGHEPMGIVEEVGPEVTKLKKGDRVIVPFNVSCGECFYCKHDLTCMCDNSNPNGENGGFFGYSDTFGGYPGGQAEYMRVPYANFTPFKIPEDCEVEDEKLLLMSDAMGTAYWSVENAGVKKGNTVIVLGCGPVGLLAQKFCWMHGAERVIAVDYIDYRLEHARRHNKVETVNFEQHENTGEYLREITHGGADVVIDCVGMDGKMTPMEFLGSGLKLQSGSLGGFVIATQAVRKGGMIQVTGVYGGRYNAFPFGDIMNRNINIRTGQAPVIPYMPTLYKLLAEGKVDPSDIITHRLPLDQAPYGYEVFDTKTDGCIKVVLKP
ncbi:putative zinc-type alcohol dehydrogenase-like protein AdhB [Clostridium beijerinckii]|jgi:S-(hydroxymethyl)glutathione dehydrogenase/alcohol dehydrogenase|uniref:Zinc-type alcohol dehydrogenase-like protein AdhB n=2 Tax=Clostridium TaxID=1485 RepID=A0AAV3VB95_9CLOT|nr:MULTISPECIES: zinc-dependent alcohol dehydrogenase [Clostridium]AVK50517.1 glutathione-dependent formaldehyde dehydrogenase [Clostridium sp. MF28]MBE6087004.1 glutathione-dependent formaldehyde dehydrogenase [Clostridium beijerinckii]MCI1581629.1 glutathione-dependent formaldehyde dehydrogenase [Clostridium beijerinckii]MCI1586083.1 glutathione-dependent formaldehyde dehydrogenase [Clostridium beijerinckii]MCI1625207.1 glutathione-dependent formaldehyde dehydrogenase [Clostridium beijerinck